MDVERRSLKGKTAILTGSTQGIGFAIARRLARDGAYVVVSSRRSKNVTKAVEDLRALGLSCDGIVCHSGRAEDRKNLIDFAISKTGRIDILVCCAGVNPFVGNFLDTPVEDWKTVMDINLISLFEMSREVIPYLEERNGGAILYVSSIGAYYPIEELGAYCVSKTALLGLTKMMATVCSRKNIRVNCICPGLIKTKFSKVIWTAVADPEERIPIGKLGNPEDCAGLAALLCSDDGRYITGENIPAAGGLPSHL